jgi:amino acid transporter
MGPAYMAEETQRASTEIPKSMLYTFTLAAFSGFMITLISAFCINDIAAMGTDETQDTNYYPFSLPYEFVLMTIPSRGYPLFNLVIAHWGETISAAFFRVVSPVGFIGGSGTLLTYASQIAAFARDGGLPFH